MGLAAKMYVKDSMTVRAVHLPDDVDLDDIQVLTEPAEWDVTFWFVTDSAQLESDREALQDLWRGSQHILGVLSQVRPPWHQPRTRQGWLRPHERGRDARVPASRHRRSVVMPLLQAQARDQAQNHSLSPERPGMVG